MRSWLIDPPGGPQVPQKSTRVKQTNLSLSLAPPFCKLGPLPGASLTDLLKFLTAQGHSSEFLALGRTFAFDGDPLGGPEVPQKSTRAKKTNSVTFVGPPFYQLVRHAGALLTYMFKFLTFLTSANLVDLLVTL